MVNGGALGSFPILLIATAVITSSTEENPTIMGSGLAISLSLHFFN